MAYFNNPDIPKNMHWFNEPARWSCGNGLEIHSDRETDFWQRTHYGFCRDNGHCLFMDVEGDFTLSTHVRFQPHNQYDQCGLMVRADAENWIKLSTEYENEQISRLGSVVTNQGYSDWATQDVPSSVMERWYRIARQGRDFFLESSEDGQLWRQMRVTHLNLASPRIEAGLYACSPTDEGFYCCFSFLDVAENHGKGE